MSLSFVIWSGFGMPALECRVCALNGRAVPMLQEGVESQGSFMASLMADMEHGSSLMPSDSAFRIASLAPQQQQYQEQGRDWSLNDLRFAAPPVAASQHVSPL